MLSKILVAHLLIQMQCLLVYFKDKILKIREGFGTNVEFIPPESVRATGTFLRSIGNEIWYVVRTIINEQDGYIKYLHNSTMFCRGQQNHI